ncbi:MAG: TadE/TadG family type IV pilus assembly protein [Fimbriiglobus sp.]
MLTSTRRTVNRDRRFSGAAAVEFALVLIFILIPVILGVWDVGRLILVQQIVANSAREGARLAAQGYTVKEDGAPLQIMDSATPPVVAGNTGSPNVKAAAFQSLHGAGLTQLRWSDVSCAFTYLDNPASISPTPTQPHEGVQNQKFRVTIGVPWNKVRWVAMPGVVTLTTVAYSVECRILVDVGFTINTTIPGVNPVP